MEHHYTLFVILSCLVGWYLLHAVRIRSKHRNDLELARANGCQSPPRLLNQRPFGVDRLEQIFRANAESRLMELFLFHFRLWGTTLEQIFLGSRAYGTIEPANLEAILSTNFQDWSMGPRRKVMFPLFGDGIFTQEGDAWKHSRELLKPQFVHKQYDKLELFHEAVDSLISVLPAQGLVDLQPLFFRLTLDTTTAFLFGDSVNSLQASNKAGESTFASAFNTAQDFMAKHQIIDRNLSRDSEGSDPGKYVFLDFLGKNTPNRTELRSQIINILVAGRDTTACLLSWTLFLLVRHPEVLAKLREEISAALKGSMDITRSELRHMNYLQNVLKESKKINVELAR
ncbi:MAG: hypothetical protein Q9203_003058 [Teloschistes exilis]